MVFVILKWFGVTLLVVIAVFCLFWGVGFKVAVIVFVVVTGLYVIFQGFGWV